MKHAKNKNVNSNIVAKDDAMINIDTHQTANIIINNAPAGNRTDLNELKNKLYATYQHPEFTKISLPFSNHNSLYMDSFLDVEIVERKDEALDQTPNSLKESNKSHQKWESVDIHDEIEKLSQQLQNEREHSPKNNMLILGRTGVGKSTFMKSIAYKWSKKELPNTFDWVFHIPLKEIVPNEKTNLCEIVYQHWAQHVYISKSTWEDIWKKMIKQKVLFLFDGYDEVSSQPVRKHINRLLQEVSHFGVYVLTTRPYHLHNLPKIECEFELIGFNIATIYKYVNGCLKDNASSLLDTIETHSNLKSIMQIPLNAALICMIWQRWPTRNFNMTVLYNLIVNYLLYRYKNATAENILDPMEIRRSVEHELQQLCTIAVSSMEKEELVFKFDMEKFCSNDVNTLLTMGLIKTTTESEGITELSQKKYYFVHLSFQEYLVAEYYANFFKSKNPALIKQARAFIIEHKFDSRYSLILSFIAGLLKDDAFAINLYFNILLEEPHDLLVRQEILLLTRCLEECQVSELLVIKEALTAYIKTILISDPKQLIYAEVLEHHPTVVHHTDIAKDLIESLKSAKNNKERHDVYEMMIDIGPTLNVGDFAKACVAMIEVAMDSSISLKSHDACQALKGMIDRTICTTDKTSVFYKNVVTAIGKDNFIQYFLHLRATLKNSSNPKLLRLGAITAISALLNLSRVVTWDSFIFIYNIVQNENEDQDIIKNAAALLEYAFDAYEVQLPKNRVNDLIDNLLKTILEDKLPSQGEKNEISKSIYGVILGNIIAKLQLDENTYYQQIIDFIWDEEKSKASRFNAAHALMGFIIQNNNIDLQDFSHSIITRLKDNETISQSTFEVALEFFYYRGLLDKQNYEEEVDFFIHLLLKPVWHDAALQCLTNMMHELDVTLVEKIVFNLGLMIENTDHFTKYIDILHASLFNISPKGMEYIAAIYIQMLDKQFSLSKSESLLDDFKKVCRGFQMMYKKSDKHINLKILLSLEKIMSIHRNTSYYKEAFFTAYCLRIHLYPHDSRTHIRSLIDFLKSRYRDNFSSRPHYEFSSFIAEHLLNAYTDYADDDNAKKIIASGLVRKFYLENIAFYIDENYFLHFHENGESKQFKLSSDEAHQLASDIQQYVEKSFGWVPFKQNTLSPQFKYICSVAAPALLVFGAKVLPASTALAFTDPSQLKCQII